MANDRHRIESRAALQIDRSYALRGTASSLRLWRLEPHIDEATMRVHHDKHHQGYVDDVNAALEGTD